jgi:DNA topoisomerase-1
MIEIGETLADANQKVWEQEKELNTMSECPICKKGHLTVKYAKKFSRYFVACDNYPECKTTYSLPPNGMMKPSRDKEGNIETCEECGYPLIISLRKGKAPWKFCFNPNCPSNKELQEKKEEFKKKIESGEIKIENGKIIDTTKNKN